MIRLLHSKKRKISTITLIAFLMQVFYPVTTFALTGGPSQAEYESFEPAGATEMVNLATGDFVYNIPLMDVDGYPLNISYHAGVTMEQEASWVGLGWSLNAGAINRGVRGIPDDFNGGTDGISDEINVKDNSTWGLNVGGGAEFVGFDFLSLGASTGFGITYNNYKGLGLDIEVGVTGAVSAGYMGSGASLTGGLGLRISNQDGADFTMYGGIGLHASASYQGSGVAANIGVNKARTNNSRRGVQEDIISGSIGGSASIQGASFGTSTGSAINLIPNTAYTPNMQYPTAFSGFTGEFHGGGEAFWCNFYGYFRGFLFNQGIDFNGITGQKFSRQAYGYLNLENSDAGSIVDFNRDNDDGIYYLECPKLPFSNLTYDLLNVNAQGLNELIRPYRNDVGYTFDPVIGGGGTAQSIGIEGNFGNLVGIGVNDFVVTTNTGSGVWFNNNNAAAVLNFAGDNQLSNDGSNKYEHAYFKALDELNIEDQNFYNNILGSNIAAFDINLVGSTPVLGAKIVGGGSSTNLSTGSLLKNNRQSRNTNFSYLNESEAGLYGLDKKIYNYPANTFSFTLDNDLDKSISSSITRTSFAGSTDHMSELTVLKDDGSRYVYGIPVYNYSKKEVIFAAQGSSAISGDMINYAGGDNSIFNTSGLDHFYLGRNTPAYAHSYLLTGLLSKDYVDITGDGLTNDDYGDYTKFNYSQKSSSYSWRNPCTNGTNTAIQDLGWRSDPRDDKGVYLYGQKDLWYPHSIETKNYIAEFFTSPRQDGKGAAGENGAISTAASDQMSRLDKIVLYSKKDLTTPIKTVNFVYDYSLCPSTPNSTAGGKLTLTKIYFTYGNSDKGVFSPYQFIYNGPNPSYDRTLMDKWGDYQVPVAPSNLTNRDFPYTQQDKTTADYNASVWNLSSIITPAQSKIDIVYESDDFGYVQDQIPAQMLTLYGFEQFKPSPTMSIGTGSQDLYQNSSPFSPNNYMIVDLRRMKDKGIVASSPSDAENILRNIMLPSSGKLYFKGFVQLGSGSVTQEFVPGYSEFDRSNSGIITTSATPTGTGTTIYKFAYIKLNEVDIGDASNAPGDNCNPISKAAWQMTRLNQPQIAYPGSEPGTGVLTAVMGLLGAITEVFTFNQKNGRLRTKLYSRNITPAKSFVRLNIPSQIKFGGGHRVKTIQITDNWNTMVNSEATTTYGQSYDYTIVNGTKTISSGVTSYEPLTGGDEISLRKPSEYSVARVMAPNDAHFFDTPVGEAFYPPSTVIYSKVTVKNIDRASVARNIGRTEYSFYTSKDYPISFGYNTINPVQHTPSPSGDLFSNHTESTIGLSQGSALYLNNMHGKLKSIYTFQEGMNNPISGAHYFYKSTPAGNVLDNTIPVMDQTGTIISNQIIGQHVEAVADFRSQNVKTDATTLDINLNITSIFYIIPIPSVFWSESKETRDFYSATLNKVVTQQGILEKVETISNYASSTTQNLIWDSKTNDVILSSTTTNFGTSDYNYHTPAHWVYPGMDAAFKNIGYGFKDVVNTTNGIITVPNNLLFPGDEVELEFTDANNNLTGRYTTDRLWVSTISGSLTLIDRVGNICRNSGAPGSNNVFSPLPSGTAHAVLKVLRSGYKNILNQEAENITYSKDPRPAVLTPSAVINYTNNVLEAGAQEFSDRWQMYCEPSDEGCGSALPLTCSTPAIFSNTNPYIRNLRGNWNGVRNYAYLGTRLPKGASTNMYDIRNDGIFNVYKQFFKFDGSLPTWKEVYNLARTSDYNSLKPFDNWILNSEVTKISPYGNVLEAKDAINRYSSSLYTYNYTLKTASAMNAKQRDIGSDGFEDYFFPNQCLEHHFGFRSYRSIVTTSEAHTGRYSLQVNAGDCVKSFIPILDADTATAYGNNYFAAAIPTPTVNNPYDCISGFAPTSNLGSVQRYLLSVWVKESVPNNLGDYPNAIVTASSFTPGLMGGPIAKSPIINGWQKLDYELDIPAGAPNTGLTFQLINNGTNIIYFDDIRIQPFNASMNTYVYDPKSLRIWAELDERNFATIYEYDNEGVLVRVKKETLKGIQTIRETRNSFKKQ